VERSDGRGVILGPYEAYWAELMWFREVVEDARLPMEYGPDHDSAIRVPAVSWQIRRRILEAGLLYGNIDTSAAGPGVVRFIDAALFKNGMLLQPDSWEAHLEGRWNSGPFERSGNGWVTPSGEFEVTQEVLSTTIHEEAAEVPDAVVSAVERYLRRVGYQRIDGMDIRSYSRTLRSRPWPPIAGMDPINASMATMGSRSLLAAMGIYAAVERSIQEGIPFVSREELAPTWIQTSDSSPQFEVVRAALDIADGPIPPKSVKALAESMNDPRVVDFRKFVSWATNRVLTAEGNAIREVQREVRRVSSRRDRVRRAEGITRVVTYIAVPVGAAEAMLRASGPGLAFAGVGALAEGFASTLKRLHRNHWITLGR
jgi:hypothetical protein